MISAVILLLLGVFLLFYVRHPWKTGAVRMGTSSLRNYMQTREDSPVIYHLGVLMYAACGLWLVVYGTMIITGRAEPVPFS